MVARISGAEPINAGPLKQLLTILFDKTRNHRYITRLWKPKHGLTSVFNICFKVRVSDDIAEAHAMQFVSRHTSVPAPARFSTMVHGTFAMSKIKGHMAQY